MLIVLMVIKMGMMALLATINISAGNDHNNGGRGGGYRDDGTTEGCWDVILHYPNVKHKKV